MSLGNKAQACAPLAILVFSLSSCPVPFRSAPVVFHIAVDHCARPGQLEDASALAAARRSAEQTSARLVVEGLHGRGRLLHAEGQVVDLRGDTLICAPLVYARDAVHLDAGPNFLCEFK